MNHSTILFIFLWYCCVRIEYTNSEKCDATVLTFPPDPKTGCCGLDVLGSDKLRGGSPVNISEYPWLALIDSIGLNDRKIQTFCGGALISGKYVLTSAHCIAESPITIKYKPTHVRLGEYNTENEGPDCIGNECTTGAIRILIESTIPHPDYDTKLRRNDIGLIRMQTAAPYTDFIRPICLPTADVTIQQGRIDFTLASWRTTEKSSPVKLYVNLPFFKQDECQKVFSKASSRIELWKGQLCAGGEKGKDSCRGDGGMPLMYQNGLSYEVSGIVSFGSSICGQENFPSVYTNVYEYRSWISSNIVA